VRSAECGVRSSRLIPHSALRTCTVVLALAVLAGCRQDMHDQPKFVPYRENSFYSDLRSERPPVPGTVARGQLRTDEVFYTGKAKGQWVDYFPFPVTKDVLKRGEERFTIYCTPCHGRLGSGEGMIVQRGLRPAANFHADEFRNAPAGRFFDAMTSGKGVMPSYAYRVKPSDRWAIIAYIRALQLSQHATAAELAEVQGPRSKVQGH